MKAIPIPITRFSKKILLSEFGAEPIKLNAGSVLSSFLYDPRRLTSTPDESVTIAIEMSYKYYSKISHGAYFTFSKKLYDFHMVQMMNFVYARVLLGDTVNNSFIAFYEMYGLDEDDYSFEAAHRRWNRFYTSKFLRKNQAKSSEKLSTSVDNLSYHKLYNIAPNVDKIERDIDKYVESHKKHFLTTKNTIRKNINLQLMIFVLMSYHKFNKTECAKMLNISWDMCHLNHRSISEYLSLHPQLLEDTRLIGSLRPV